MYRLLLCILLSFNWNTIASDSRISSNNDKVIRFNQDQPSKILGQKVYYLIEEGRPLTLKDVMSPRLSKEFQLSPGKSPNFGIPKQVYWFRLSIEYESLEKTSDTKYIELDYPYLDHIEFYSRELDNEYTKFVTGDHYPFAQRPIESQVFVFKTTLSSTHLNHLYFRVDTKASLQMPLTIWQPETFIKANNKSRLALGLYYGAMLIMFFYNLFVFISVRDKSYLYYIAYLLAVAIAQLTIDGVAFELLWPNTPLLANISGPIFMNLTIITAVLFAREYLNIKQFAPQWNIAANILVGVVVVSFTPLLLGDIGASVGIATLLLIFMGGFLLSLGAWGIYKKQRKAYFFFAAWLALCLGASAKAALILNIAPLNFITSHGGQIGVLIELTLLSFALADRMNLDRSEKLKAMNSALAASREALQANNDRREAERQLIQQSLYDQLTGHPNRLLCKEQLQSVINQTNSSTHTIAIICIHLNNFHDINNTLGHDIGDQLLIKFVSLLEQEISGWDDLVGISQGENIPKYVAIIEGVYLSVILVNSKGQDIQEHANRLLELIEAPVTFNGLAVIVGGQIGASLWPAHGSDAETLMRKSMIAVRAAKWVGRNLKIYEESIDRYNAKRLSLMSELKKAIPEHQLELHYQPKVDMKTQKTVSVEALVRWNHPDQGLLSPDKFVSFAESTGIIQPLTQWVLNEAICFCIKLLDKGYDIGVAVNISARNLLEEDFVTRISSLLEKYQLQPSKLTLEVVESTMIEDMELTIGTLNRINTLGVRLSIDDFGTGYSSLQYLKKLPVHELKIDRSFVSDMVNNDDDKLIVTTALAIAHQRGMSVVAEGIEDKKTFNLLTEMGCNIGQGYFISKPIEQANLLEFLKNNKISKTTQ